MNLFDVFLETLLAHMHERDMNYESCIVKSGTVEISLENYQSVSLEQKELFIEKLLIVNGFVVGLQYRKSKSDIWKTVPNFCFERTQKKEGI